MSCAWEVCVGVLTASPPVLPGKTGIASGSSLSDVPDMDCSSSAIDDLIKEVRPHLGCRRSAGSGWLIKNSLLSKNSVCRAAGLDLQLVQGSQHQDTALMLAPAFHVHPAGREFTGGWSLSQLCAPSWPSHTWLLPLSSSRGFYSNVQPGQCQT